MKIRNKRLMTALVTVFALVFLAGSALALVANGPLVFQGTANVDAMIQLAIINDGDSAINSVSGVVGNITYSFDREIAPDTDRWRTMNLEVDFSNTVKAGAGLSVPVKNTGTLPAIIDTELVVVTNPELPAGGYLADFVDFEIGKLQFPDGIVPLDGVLQPGETVLVFIIFDFDSAGYLGYSIDDTVVFRLDVNYKPA